MKIFKLMTLGLFTVLISCADYKYSTKETPESVDGILGKPECITSPYDFTMDINVLSYEVNSKYGFVVGLSGVVKWLTNIELDFKYNTGNMYTNLTLSEPTNMNSYFSEGNGNGAYKEVGAGVTVELTQLVNVGFNYYTQTPLYKLAQDSMVKSMKSLVSDYSKKYDWKTKIDYVLKDSYGEIYYRIPMGIDSGIQTGDEFLVYDTDYKWTSGDVCNSEPTIIEMKEIAKLKVYKNISSTYALLKVSEKISNTEIKTGDIVRMGKLIQLDPKKSRMNLARPVHIENVDTNAFAIASSKLLLKKLLSTQIRSLKNEYFYFQ